MKMKNTIIVLFALTLNFCAVVAQEGTLVTSFGTDGLAINSILDGDSELLDVIYYNSNYYAVGKADVEGRAEILIMKYGENGSVVSSFGTNGFLSIPKGSGASELTKIEIAEDGNLLSSGWMRDGNNEVALVVKFDQNGNLQSSFGEQGIVELRIANSSFGEDRANEIIQKNGRIYFSSISYTGLSDVIGVACLESDGSLCEDFGNGGKINHTIDEAIGSHGAQAMIMHPDGGFVIGGEVKFDFFDENSLYLFKIDSQGNVDESFGDQGVSVFGFGGDIKTGLNTLIIDSEDKIVVGGGAFDIENLDNNFFIARFDLQGNLDDSFGNNGTNVLSLSANEAIRSLLLNPDGRIIAGGSTGGSPSNFMLARYTSEGQLDPTFGNGGYIQSSFTQGFNAIRGIDFGENENIIAAGYVSSGDDATVLAMYSNSFFVSTSDENLGSSVELFPIPFSDALTLSYESTTNQILAITICDQKGRLLFSYSTYVVNGNNQIDLSQMTSFPAGIYFMNLSTEEGKTTKRLIKQ